MGGHLLGGDQARAVQAAGVNMAPSVGISVGAGGSSWEGSVSFSNRKMLEGERAKKDLMGQRRAEE